MVSPIFADQNGHILRAVACRGHRLCNSLAVLDDMRAHSTFPYKHSRERIKNDMANRDFLGC